jgi:hypothetical protein
MGHRWGSGAIDGPSMGPESAEDTSVSAGGEALNQQLPAPMRNLLLEQELMLGAMIGTLSGGLRLKALSDS